MARTEREQFIGRLAIYLLGIAIGCVILGLFSVARQRELQRQGAIEASAQPAATSTPAAK